MANYLHALCHTRLVIRMNWRISFSPYHKQTNETNEILSDLTWSNSCNSTIQFTVSDRAHTCRCSVACAECWFASNKTARKSAGIMIFTWNSLSAFTFFFPLIVVVVFLSLQFQFDFQFWRNVNGWKFGQIIECCCVQSEKETRKKTVNGFNSLDLISKSNAIDVCLFVCKQFECRCERCVTNFKHKRQQDKWNCFSFHFGSFISVISLIFVRYLDIISLHEVTIEYNWTMCILSPNRFVQRFFNFFSFCSPS